jgi:hypothetical protein
VTLVGLNFQKKSLKQSNMKLGMVNLIVLTTSAHTVTRMGISTTNGIMLKVMGVVGFSTWIMLMNMVTLGQSVATTDTNIMSELNDIMHMLGNCKKCNCMVPMIFDDEKRGWNIACGHGRCGYKTEPHKELLQAADEWGFAS